jgi:hypothetical protein
VLEVPDPGHYVLTRPLSRIPIDGGEEGVALAVAAPIVGLEYQPIVTRDRPREWRRTRFLHDCPFPRGSDSSNGRVSALAGLVGAVSKVSALCRRPNADGHGTAAEGLVIINPPGTRRRVLRETGCIALTIYEKLVRFIDAS